MSEVPEVPDRPRGWPGLRHVRGHSL